MIDLHSHLLPGVDDGSQSVEQSLVTLREMAGQGVTDVCLTPHLLASRLEQGVPPAHDAAYASLMAAATTDIRLYRGAEVMLDRPFTLTADRCRPFTLGGSRYVLVEFPRLVAGRTVLQALKLLSATGLVPLVAHPERYSSCSPETVRLWRECGALMQVDANTMLTGRARGERARQLVGAGLADIAAGDNHGDDRSLAALFQALERQGGAEPARQLMVDNPRAILEDRPTTPVTPLDYRPSLLRVLRGLLSPEEDR